jgi:hypothetical protein
MKYQTLSYKKIDGTDGKNILRIAGDEVVTLGLGEEDPGYIEWIAEGNTPTEWTPQA